MTGTTPTAAPERRPFWRRQFDRFPTGAQRRFDAIFALIVPALCFLADPGIFRVGAVLDPPVLDQFRLAGYASATSALLVLVLVWKRVPPSALLPGALIGFGAISLAIGLVMLPITFVGLFIGIGVFGFTPLLTAFALARIGIRAYVRGVDRIVGRRWPRAWLAIGILLAVMLPILIQTAVASRRSEGVERIRAGDLEAGVELLRSLPCEGAHVQLLVAYQGEPDGPEKGRLSEAYRTLTGWDPAESRD